MVCKAGRDPGPRIQSCLRELPEMMVLGKDFNFPLTSVTQLQLYDLRPKLHMCPKLGPVPETTRNSS